MATGLHVIFDAGVIGLATLDALRRRGRTVLRVNRCGKAQVPNAVEVVAGDAADAVFAVRAAQGDAVVYQTLNPPYHQWGAQFPALQAVPIQRGSLRIQRLRAGHFVAERARRPDV